MNYIKQGSRVNIFRPPARLSDPLFGIPTEVTFIDWVNNGMMYEDVNELTGELITCWVPNSRIGRVQLVPKQAE